jgi:hypothetical protein
MRFIKIDKISLKKGNIFKVLNSKKLFPIKETYITTIKKKILKTWRCHKNCDTVLLCIKGNAYVETENLKKKIKDDFKFITLIKKNTKFRISTEKNNSLIMSFLKIPHNKIKSIYYDN